MARRSQTNPNRLARMSIAALHAEIRRRQGRVRTLERRRDRLASKLAALDRQIEAAGGSAGGMGRGGRGRAGGTGRRRPQNTMTLTESLGKVLADKTMSVTEAAEAVQRAGYKTNSSNFRTQVNLALIKGKFKRVGRGMYTAK
jgi:hypothetical protein